MDSSSAAVSAVRWKRVAGWYGRAFAGSALCCALAHRTENKAIATTCLTLSMAAPLAASIIVQRQSKEPVLEALGVGTGSVLNRWGLAAVLLPAAIAGLSVPASLAFPGVHLTDEKFVMVLKAKGASDKALESTCSLVAKPLVFGAISLLQGIGAGSMLNVWPCFGEESGWRGWLLRELAPLGFWKASTLSGILWGLWHAPHIYLLGLNYPGHRITGIPMMALFCTFLSPSITFVRCKTRSVWAAAAFHGVLNGCAPNLVLWLGGGSELMIGIPGLAGIIVMACVNAAIAVLAGTPSLEDIDITVKKQADNTC